MMVGNLDTPQSDKSNTSLNFQVTNAVFLVNEFPAIHPFCVELPAL
jgi:hypothetical protein